nr:hypothetical protein [Tanacetum cinerariifolium]
MQVLKTDTQLIYTCNEILVERELAIYKESVSETVRWISYGLRATVVKYDAYNINGYSFLTKCHDGKVYQNSEVSVEAIDLHISKEVATTKQAFYYEVLQEIWVLDYHFRKIPLFKCDWVNHRADGVKRDTTLGYTLADLNNLGHKTSGCLVYHMCIVSRLIGGAEESVEEDDRKQAHFLGGKISSGRKKSRGSNISDSGNTRDGGKTVSGAIGACGSGIGDSLPVALYAYMTFIYGSSWKGKMASEAHRSLNRSFEGLEKVFLGKAGDIKVHHRSDMKNLLDNIYKEDTIVHTGQDPIHECHSPMSKAKYVLVLHKHNPNVKIPNAITGCVLGLLNVDTWDDILNKFRMRKPERCADK